MDIAEMVGKRVRETREVCGWTQQQVGDELANHLGKPWTRQAVSVAEKGGRAFTVAELVALAAVLGTTVTRLLTPDLETSEVRLPAVTFRTAVYTDLISDSEGSDVGLGEMHELLRRALGYAADAERGYAKAAVAMRALVEIFDVHLDSKVVQRAMQKGNE
ncbi:helix-turn-helix transcriptional regulator [Saccharopolyspora cebuensis]|uniref:Helix-turn-helix transcriptional regulator n=1 Tax=Saccharopolyspora cebuensis TaxID=418759 RepID=A0ABV4CHT3_9PSEU